MTWLDYAVLGVLAASLAWGVWRGLVREVVSVTGWVIAFLVANLLGGPVGDTLPESWGRPEVRVLIAFVAVFVLTLAVTTLVAVMLAKILKAVGLGALDRTLGALFGLVRGVLVVLAFGLVAGLSPLPNKPLWRNSLSGPLLEQAVGTLKPWLPPALRDRLRYH
jgi:membrane protein required for colicin V production